MSRSPRPSSRVPDETFVEIWQEGASLADVARTLRVAPREASLRAFALRRAGVPLKRFTRGGGGIDVEALATIAERHAPRKR